MDQLICASLSHTHHWYKVGKLKVPANYCKTSVRDQDYSNMIIVLRYKLYPQLSMKYSVFALKVPD